MNQGWVSMRLGDMGRIVTGRTPPTSNPEYFGTDYPFVTPSDMVEGRKSVKTERFLSERGATLLQRNLLPPRSVAVSCIGWQMGRAVMISRPSFTNQQLNAIVPNENIDPDFLYYSLVPMQRPLLSLGSATGVRTPILNKTAFSDIRLWMPPLPTQRKIADILSAYDDLIENNTRRIKILEEMAQMIYREWFVHFRFPGHEQAAMVETELGLIPDGWQRVALGQIAEINARSIRGSVAPDVIRYVDISSVSTGQIDTIMDMRFDQAPGRARRILRHGDTIWSCVRPNRKSYSLIISPTENMIASTGFAVISPLSVPYTFLYQSVTTDEFIAYLTNHARGAAYPAVTAEDFEHAVVQLPDPVLTHQYHAIVEPMSLLKHSLQERNSKLRQTRDLLLPKLVSGEVKVDQERLL